MKQIALKIIDNNGNFRGWFSYARVEFNTAKTLKYRTKKNTSISTFKVSQYEMTLWDDDDKLSYDGLQELIEDIENWFNSDEIYEYSGWKCIPVKIKNEEFKWNYSQIR